MSNLTSHARRELELAGADDEWDELREDAHNLQNNRVPSVFKDPDDGRAFNVDGLVWVTPNGVTFTGRVDGIRSGQRIKAFPFTPKTFYVDVLEVETAPGECEFHVKDRAQLEAVAAYYDLDLSEDAKAE